MVVSRILSQYFSCNNFIPHIQRARLRLRDGESWFDEGLDLHDVRGDFQSGLSAGAKALHRVRA